MICHNCGKELQRVVTNMPFKTNGNSVIIIKDLPVLQCEGCGEYLIEDVVMSQVDEILKNVNKNTELEILKFAS